MDCQTDPGDPFLRVLARTVQRDSDWGPSMVSLALIDMAYQRVMTAKPALLRDRNAAAAHFLRDVLHLRQAILQRQHRLLIVHVNAGLVLEPRNHGRVHIDQVPMRMIGEQVTAAALAPLTR